MKYIFTTCLLLSTCIVWSQKIPFKIGKISDEEIHSTADKVYPEADAVVLGEYGSTTFRFDQNKGWQYVFEHQVRVKIYSKEGLEQANISIPFYEGESGNREKISGLKAFTYNIENGKVEKTKMEKDAIFEEKRSENWYLQKFTLPQVKIGSVIEYDYTLTSDYISNLHTWEFQKEIPVRLSEYRIKIPEFFNYQKLQQGYEELDVNESTTFPETFSISYTSLPQAGGKVEKGQSTLKSLSKSYRWVATDLPAVKSEPFMTAPSDYYTKMGFQLLSVTYPSQPVQVITGTYEGEFNKQFLEHERFGKLLDHTKFAEDLLPAIIAGATTKEEKLLRIYEYVKMTMNWNDQYRLFASKNLKSIHNDKEGSVADINLLLIGMLRAAGIETYPVILSTRSNGKPHPFYPSNDKFNYVIGMANINGKQYLMDATAKSLPVNVLPEKVLNGKGWMISNHPGWVTLIGNSSQDEYTTIKANFEDGNLKANIKIKRNGLKAALCRNRYQHNGEEDYRKESLKSLSEWELLSTSYENTDNIYSSFIENIDVQQMGQVGADLIYLDPIIVGGLKENWFKNDNRKFPVDFPTDMKKTCYLQLEIPEGYKIEELPENTMLVLPDSGASFRYSIAANGNKLVLVSIMEIKKTMFSFEEYPNLKKFLDLIVSKHNEQLVLKKM